MKYPTFWTMASICYLQHLLPRSENQHDVHVLLQCWRSIGQHWCLSFSGTPPKTQKVPTLDIQNLVEKILKVDNVSKDSRSRGVIACSCSLNHQGRIFVTPTIYFNLPNYCIQEWKCVRKKGKISMTIKSNENTNWIYYVWLLL